MKWVSDMWDGYAHRVVMFGGEVLYMGEVVCKE